MFITIMFAVLSFSLSRFFFSLPSLFFPSVPFPFSGSPCLSFPVLLILLSSPLSFSRFLSFHLSFSPYISVLKMVRSLVASRVRAMVSCRCAGAPPLHPECTGAVVCTSPRRSPLTLVMCPVVTVGPLHGEVGPKRPKPRTLTSAPSFQGLTAPGNRDEAAWGIPHLHQSDVKVDLSHVQDVRLKGQLLEISRVVTHLCATFTGST